MESKTNKLMRDEQWIATIKMMRSQMECCRTALGAACTVLEDSSDEYELASNKAYCATCHVLGELECAIDEINKYINQQNQE